MYYIEYSQDKETWKRIDVTFDSYEMAGLNILTASALLSERYLRIVDDSGKIWLTIDFEQEGVLIQ